MKYFLYHDFGSCSDGDHSNGFEQFDTLEEARAGVKDLAKRNSMDIDSSGYWDECFHIVAGETVPIR